MHKYSPSEGCQKYKYVKEGKSFDKHYIQQCEPGYRKYQIMAALHKYFIPCTGKFKFNVYKENNNIFLFTEQRLLLYSMYGDSNKIWKENTCSKFSR
jgi:hypothetical protein